MIPEKTSLLRSLAIVVLIFTACKEVPKSAVDNLPAEEEDPSIHIVTKLMDFQVQDTIKSGWQTFKYSNQSSETHFFLLEKYPEGKSLEDARTVVVPVFQKGMNLLNEGKNEEAMAAFGELPEWFQQIVFMGGSGLISPGETAVSTLHMEPGYYVMECYVKMENGTFHSAMGMLEDLVVLPDSVEFSPPSPTVSLGISKEEGIVLRDSVRSGPQVIEVNFVDQAVHEHFVGHDVNLVKLGENADVEALAKWMNWSDPKGLITPAPAGVTFLGGINEMPAGSTGYFSVSLSPGNYAFISEVPSPAEKNMLIPFRIE